MMLSLLSCAAGGVTAAVLSGGPLHSRGGFLGIRKRDPLREKHEREYAYGANEQCALQIHNMWVSVTSESANRAALDLHHPRAMGGSGICASLPGSCL